MARYGAVKYAQFADQVEPFSMHGPLPQDATLLEDATRLLDMKVPSEPLSNWQRGFYQGHWQSFEQPACLWRARNGWLIVHIATSASWRDFCATFLNRTIQRQVNAHSMWRSRAAHELVTTILSTHDVSDAAMTCQLYEIPAAVVCHAKPYEQELQASRLEWAVLSASTAEVHDIFNRGISNGK